MSRGKGGAHKIEAVLFDMDGVLIDATEWHYQALNRALQLFGFSIPRVDHLSTYNGLPTKKKLEMLSIEKGLPTTLHEFINRIKQVYTKEEILKQCRPFFEKEYMASRLKREGYRLAVCSNAIRESVELMVRQSGLTPYFEFMISNEEVSKPKPDPEMYLKAIDRMGLHPKQVVVVEDAPLGIKAAENAGAHVCRVGGFGEVDYFLIKEFIDQAERSGA